MAEIWQERDLGGFVRQLREKRGLTQAQLAEIMQYSGKSGSVVSRIEANQRATPELVAAIIRALDIEEGSDEREELLYRAGLGPPPGAQHPIMVRLRQLLYGDQILSPEVAEAILESVGSTVKRWRIYELARTQRHQRRWAEAKGTYEQGLQLLNADRAYERAVVKDGMATLAFYQGKMSEARTLYDEAASWIKLAIDSITEPYPSAVGLLQQALIKMHLGDVRRALGEWDSAERAYKEAQEIYNTMRLTQFENEDDRQVKQVAEHIAQGILKGKGVTERKLGSLSNFRSQWKDALEHLRQSEEFLNQLADEHDRKYELAKTFYNHAWSYYLKGEWDTSLSYYERGYRLAQDVDDPYTILKGHRLLGNAYRVMGDLPRALEELEKAEGLAVAWPAPGDGREDTASISSDGPVLELAMIYLSIAQVAISQLWEGEYKVCEISSPPNPEEYFDKAKQKAEEVGDEFRRGLVLNELGRYYARHRDISEALPTFTQALGIFENLKSAYYQVAVYVNLCEAYCHYKAGLGESWRFVAEYSGKAFGILHQAKATQGHDWPNHAVKLYLARAEATLYQIMDIIGGDPIPQGYLIDVIDMVVRDCQSALKEVYLYGQNVYLGEVVSRRILTLIGELVSARRAHKAAWWLCRNLQEELDGVPEFDVKSTLMKRLADKQTELETMLTDDEKRSLKIEIDSWWRRRGKRG